MSCLHVLLWLSNMPKLFLLQILLSHQAEKTTINWEKNSKRSSLKTMVGKNLCYLHSNQPSLFRFGFFCKFSKFNYFENKNKRVTLLRIYIPGTTFSFFPSYEDLVFSNNCDDDKCFFLICYVFYRKKSKKILLAIGMFFSGKQSLKTNNFCFRRFFAPS